MTSSATEKTTDLLVYSLLKEAHIDAKPNKSGIKEVDEALKTASKRLTGKSGYPEFLALSGDFIIVIEDKKENKYQRNAIPDKPDILIMDAPSVSLYAENGALHYARHIAKLTNFKKIFAFGCSGDSADSLLIRPIYVNDKTYIVMPYVKDFQNFSSDSISSYYQEKVLKGKNEKTIELENILNRAKQLHEDLRNYGSLAEQEKPMVVSAILLALRCESFSTTQLTCGQGETQEDKRSDGEKIYDAAYYHVTEEVEAMPQDKTDILFSQFNFIRQRPILSNMNARLGKSPLKYFAEYIQSKVLSAIENNTTDDVLGRFYGEFLSYSGGDGKGLGIVLTPSHITQLLADLVDVSFKDKVFDPTCGTAGFDIAAMNRMLGQIDQLSIPRKRREDLKKYVKRNNLHGIEMQDRMFAIATTNMILRGDGKSHLKCQDFFKVSAEEMHEEHYTVGLMNPPYSQAKKKETAHLSELHFIKHLLDGLDDGGRAAVIVPQSTMVGKTTDDKRTKKQILENHTLEGVITCNPQTFYKVGTNTVIAIFKAH